MSEKLDIPREVREAVAEAIFESDFPDCEPEWASVLPSERDEYLLNADAAITAFCEAIGLEVEKGTFSASKLMDGPNIKLVTKTRLVTPWTPINTAEEDR